MMGPLGSAPWGAIRRRDPTGTAGALAGPDLGPVFYAIELSARQPGSLTPAEDRGIGAAPFGALARRVAARESVVTLRASDAGYVTRPTDGPGTVAYPPLLDSPFSVTREMGLAPDQALQTFGWGSASLLNADRRWDAVAATYDANGRRARVLAGRKQWEEARGLWIDPPYASLVEVFSGVAGVWSPGEDALDVPLRDVSYLIERTLQAATYSGAGGYEGTAAMAGLLKPKARGGTASAPIRQVTPRLIDPVNQIYQYTDGPGTVVALYEAGRPAAEGGNIAPGGDVPSLAAGTTQPGQYRTCNALGLFQLGSKPAGTITIDVTGGANATAALIALDLLLTDMQVPAAYVDQASFYGLAAMAPWPCGWWWGEETSGAAAVTLLLASVGARLVTTRTGLLRAVALAAPGAGLRPAAVYTPAEIVALVPLPLSAPLSPAPAAWQVGYARNHTVQTSGLASTLSAAAAAALGQTWRQAGAVGAEVLAMSSRPSRPAMVESALLSEAGALALATQLRDLWCTARPRRAYRMTLPAEMALRHELGTPLVVAYPVDDLDVGRLCQVVGDALRAGDDTGTITILV